MTAAIFGVHNATFLNYETKVPIFRSDIITAVAINDTGDLVAREGGSLDYAIEHFQARKQIEIQVTSKEWRAGLYQIAAGAKVVNLSPANSNVVLLSSKNAVMDFTFEDTNAGSLYWGSFALIYNGTAWDLYLLEDSASNLEYNENSLQLGSALALSSTAAHLGNGVSAKYDTGYTTPEEGDYILFSVSPKTPVSFSASVSQGDRRPYVSGLFACESQGDLATVYIPKMRCSSGLPINMNEKADNENQITFMASLENRTSEIWKLTQRAS